jgi:hypothetical protein
MTAPVFVSIPHRLGREEAVRRLKNGFSRAHANFSGFVTIDQEVWEGDKLQFQMRALGQAASGTIEVCQDHVQVEVILPWLLAKISERLIPVIRRETALLLEKK